jgi:hypothetical protein
MSSTVNLLNNAWQSGVRTEVHKGNNQDANQNPSLGIRVVAYGDVWPITTTENVQWRRELDPDAPTGQWAGWNEQAYGLDGQTYEIEL